jgi:predicted Zn-dependent protease
MLFRPVIQFLWIFCLLLTLSSCRSKDGDLNFFSVQQDLSMGNQFKQLLNKNTAEFPMLDPDEYPELYERVNDIIQQIVSSPDMYYSKEFAWELHIINDDNTLNAFCTPGGYIYIYTGLIKFLDSEDQLAGVLGHEIAHADLRHSSEQLTKSYGLRILLRIILGDNSFLGNVAGNLIGLTFSRKDETEADMQSVVYLKSTEYDPRGVARFFQKMEADGKQHNIEFLSTHPNPEHRLEAIYKKWKSLGSPEGKTFKKRYEQMKLLLPS